MREFNCELFLLSSKKKLHYIWIAHLCDGINDWGGEMNIPVSGFIGIFEESLQKRLRLAFCQAAE